MKTKDELKADLKDVLEFRFKVEKAMYFPKGGLQRDIIDKALEYIDMGFEAGIQTVEKCTMRQIGCTDVYMCDNELNGDFVPKEVYEEQKKEIEKLQMESTMLKNALITAQQFKAHK